MTSTQTAHTNTPSPPRTWRLGARLVVYALFLVGLLWLGTQTWQRNLADACWRQEWPGLPGCPPLAERSPSEQAAALRERVARNPGDSQAWVALAVLVQPEGGLPGEDSAALLAVATQLAPNDVRVLLMHAQRALQANDWSVAVERLGKLAVFHNHAGATRALAELIARAAHARRMQPAPAELAGLPVALELGLQTEQRWLERAVRAMPRAKLAVVDAMPLVAQAMEQGTLSPALGQFVISQLKAGGHWLDAHAVWLSLWKQPLGLLFNGSFEQPFVAQGFDWEVTDANTHRAGAQVRRVGRGERGQVLQVVLTGRQIRLPIVRQHLLLTPGRYRLTGEFQSTDLRSQQGLSWVLSCAGSAQRPGPGLELGRSAPLQAKGRSWQALDLVFEVPPDCGLGVALALQPQAAFEARTGMRGEMLFDGLSLTRVGAL